MLNIILISLIVSMAIVWLCREFNHRRVLRNTMYRWHERRDNWAASYNKAWDEYEKKSKECIYLREQLTLYKKLVSNREQAVANAEKYIERLRTTINWLLR